MGKTKGVKGKCLTCKYLEVTGYGCLCQANKTYNSIGRELLSNNDRKRMKESVKYIGNEFDEDTWCNMNYSLRDAMDKHYEYNCSVFAILTLRNKVNPSWCPLRKEEENEE